MLAARAAIADLIVRKGGVRSRREGLGADAFASKHEREHEPGQQAALDRSRIRLHETHARMVLAVDEDDGSVRTLIPFLPILAIERAAVKCLLSSEKSETRCETPPSSLPSFVPGASSCSIVIFKGKVPPRVCA